MLIDQVYKLIQFIANIEQRGNLTPSQFNVAAEMAQREFVSRRLGNLKQIGASGLPLYGYESSWRVHEDLQPMIYGPVTIPVAAPSGNFAYPYGYIHVDAFHGVDFTPITRLTADQYPHVKRSVLIPPSMSYPVVVFRHPYGQVDPYQIGNIAMSYLRHPPTPIWAYVVINDSPVFNVGTSVDFAINPINANELAMIILAHLGVNLSAEQLTGYAAAKDSAGT